MLPPSYTTESWVAFRFIVANSHPDHDTPATFRRRFLDVALDSTKIHVNVSRHRALSYEYAKTLETQLKQVVAELLALVESEDRADVPDGQMLEPLLSIIKSVIGFTQFSLRELQKVKGE